MVGDERDERALLVDHADAGCVPRQAPRRIGAAVERIDDGDERPVGVVTAGLLAQHAQPCLDQQRHGDRVGSTIDRYWPRVGSLTFQSVVPTSTSATRSAALLQEAADRAEVGSVDIGSRGTLVHGVERVLVIGPIGEDRTGWLRRASV